MNHHTTITGTSDDDLLDAGTATVPHLIFGLARNDTIIGTAFDDTIDGGRDNDSLAGGDGNDVFLVEGGNQGVDRIDGGAGFDRIRGGAGDDHIGIVTLASIEEIDGGAGSNTIGGSSSSNLLDFSATALLGISLIDGGRGNDTIIGTALDDTIEGGADNDSLSGGDGNDSFLVTGSNNGADRIDGGAGFDRIVGSTGDDQIRLANLASIEQIDGRAGSNAVSGTGNSEVLDLSGTTLVNINLIDGGKGNDTIIGTFSDDTIMGGIGNDRLNGGGGNDVAVYFGNQADYEITVDSDGVAIVSGGSEGGTDRLVNISFLSFADGIVDLNGGSDGTPPVAQDDAATTDEETAVTLDVLSNDTSQTGGTLELLSVTQGANGTVQINADGTVTYRPALDFFGEDSFTYQVGDGSPGSSTATVTVTVLNQPDSPVAADDSATTQAGTPVVIDVLANDQDADGTQPTLLDFGQGTNGSVTENPNGTLTYTPNAGTLGQDSFAYTITDGTTTDTATVNVTVQDEPPPPGSLTFRQLLTSMPEGDWLRLNTNIYRDVWTPQAQWALDNPSPKSVIGAWSSMAWDSNRGDLIFWGGGHATYAGNEVYRWRSSTLEWERASLPSDVVRVADNRFDTIDGHLNSPLSSHTYDNNEFLPIADRFITFGGAALGSGGNFRTTDGSRATGPYLWDPSKADGNKVGGITGSHVHPERFPDVVGGQMWENRDNPFISENDLGFLQGVSAYAQEEGHDVIYIGRKALYKYTLVDISDPSLDTFEKVGDYRLTFGKDGAGALDTINNIFVRIAGSRFTYWDLDTAGPNNPNVSFRAFDATGTFDDTLINDYGMDFDPVRGVFLLWNGSPQVWSLTPPETLGANGWILEPLPAGPSVGPDELGTTVGVFGKWKYAAEQDIFLGVNDPITGDVWAYKPENWQPTNSLPEISLAEASTFTATATDPAHDYQLLTDLIQWDDADGDLLSFEIIDLTDDANSGFFQLAGTAVAAETAIVVGPDQIISGDLVWISGQTGVYDDISIEVRDPFGSAPEIALRLPGDSPSTASSMLVADAEAAPLDLTDLLQESDPEGQTLPSDVVGEDAGGSAAPSSGDAGAGAGSFGATTLVAGLDSETEQQILAQT
jgi:Ca2+-binding RTX toxin-like protein